MMKEEEDKMIVTSSKAIKFDETEASLGISAYMSPKIPGFSGVLKARYSDFIVHEVNQHGIMASLDSIEYKATPTPTTSTDGIDSNAAPSTSSSKTNTTPTTDSNANATTTADEKETKPTTTTTTTIENNNMDVDTNPNDKCNDEDGTNKNKTEVDSATGATNTTDENETNSNKNENSNKRKRDENDSNSNEKEKMDFDILHSQLLKLIKDETVTTQVMTMLKTHEKDRNTDGNNNTIPNDTTLGNTNKPEPTKSLSSTAASTSAKYVTLPSIEKSQRKPIHDWVRLSVPCGKTDTVDGKIRIWHKAFEKEMSNYKTFNNREKNNNRKQKNNKNKRARRNDDDDSYYSNSSPSSTWPTNQPNYLQFVLYKENIDTTTATKEISWKNKKARIGFAGMKDKRGITCQFCTLYRTTPQQLINTINDTFHSKGGGNTKTKGYSIIKVGNFSFVNAELRLGMLQGNRFDIVLRNVQVDSSPSSSSGTSSLSTAATEKHDESTQRKHELLKAAAKALQEKGFINYFGTQRFGKFNDTHLVGIAILQGDYQKAVNIILQPKHDERADIKSVREEWQNRFKVKEETTSKDSEKQDNESELQNEPQNNENDQKPNNQQLKEMEAKCAKRIVRSLSRFMTAENAILQSLSRKPLDYKRAFLCIPKTLKLMYLHALQSLIWNQVASYRINSMSHDSVLEGDLVLESLTKSTAATSNTTTDDSTSRGYRNDVHVVTKDDITNNRFTLQDVVLPLVGRKSMLPTNESKQMIEKLFQNQNITMDMMTKFQDRDLSLHGEYRKLICIPSDIDCKIMEYYDPLQPLIQTDLMKLNGQTITIDKNSSSSAPPTTIPISSSNIPKTKDAEGENKKQNDGNLKDETKEVKEENRKESETKTSTSKDGSDVEMKDSSIDDATGVGKSAVTSSTASTTSSSAPSRDPLISMIVGFTLPSSSYATIALRELMKKPTSSEYQKELKLEG